MPDPPKQRGGTDSARRRGWAALVVHLTQAEKAEADGAARAHGLTAKEWARRALAAAARSGEAPPALPPLP